MRQETLCYNKFEYIKNDIYGGRNFRNAERKMGMKLKKLLFLCMALVIAFGALSPGLLVHATVLVYDEGGDAAVMKFEDYTVPTILDPEDYKIYISVTTGDMIWGQDYSFDTPEAIDEFLDVLQDMGFSRIYWRGLQMAVMANQLTVRPESNIRMMYQAINYDANYSENTNFGGLTIDQYLVQEAHKRGMEVIGQTTLADFGGLGDSTLTNYPYAHYSYHMENPEWSPVDEWGVMRQGGAVEFSYAEARKYIIDLTMEEVKKVGYDGVMFYSHTENFDMKYEDQFGYNEPAVEEFERRYGITPEQDNLNYRVSLEHWRMLRGEYLTSFLREMKAALVEYNPDAIIALNVSSSKPRQPEVYGNYYDSMITNNIYMDYETYVQENIVDELHVKGNTDMNKHIKMIEDMLWLCRDTDTEVVIVTSAVNLEAANVYDYWTPYLQRGVAVEFFTCTDDGIYRYGPDISDKIDTLSEESQLRYHLVQVAIGKEKATLDQLKQWMQMDSITIPRLAMLALVRYYRGDAGPLLEKALYSDKIGIRGFALKQIVAYKITTPTMAATILKTVDLDNAFSTFEFAGEALAFMNTTQRDVMWDAFTDPNTSLRAKMCAIQGMNGTAMSEAEVAVLHEVITGDAFATEYDDIYDADSKKALEASYKKYIRWYSVANMYHAGRLGSETAKQYLIDYVTTDDTVVASVAIDLIGSAGGFLNAEQTEQTIAALDTVYSRLSTASDYIYDGDFKQWAYRPAGDSLVKLGDAGKEVLEKYYSGNDKKLALDAFKCLYMPQSAKNVTLLTYAEYKAVYERLPAALSSYSAVKLEQDFEDTSVFNADANPAALTWNGSADGVGGRWYWGGDQIKITKANARSGEQSLLLTGNMSAYTGSAGWNRIMSDDGQNYKLSLWIYHEGGTANFATAINTAGSIYSDPEAAEVFVQILDDGKVMVYDKANAAFVDTGLIVPKHHWAQVTIESLRADGANKAYVSVRPEGGVASSSEAFAIVAQDVGTMVLRMTHQGSNAITYVDDVLWLLPATDTNIDEDVITLDSDSVVYNGEPHGLTAVTLPDTLQVKYTYTDSNGTVLPDGTLPVNAGVYTVTATVVDDGYHSASAVATLEIRRANTVVTGTATAAPVLLGNPLRASALNVESLVVTPYGDTVSLEGTYVWENPDMYCTGSGMQTFIFTPDDPNYKPTQGTAMVYVTGDTYETIAVLDQDFEDTDLFKANATETYTAGNKNTVDGYWYNLHPQTRSEGGAIYALENVDGVTGQVVQLKRTAGGDSIRLYAAVNNGVASYDDFTLTIRAYRENNQTMIVDLAGMYIYIKPDGAINVYDRNSNWVSTGVSLGAGKWTDVIITSDRVTGTFSVSVQPVGGNRTTGTTKGILKNVDITSLNMYATSNGTVSPYIDSVRLEKMVPVRIGGATIVETDVLNQDFEDTETFRANVTEAYTAGSADTVGGYWSKLHPHDRENGAAIYRMETVDGNGQVIQLKRNSSDAVAIWLNGTVSNGVANNEDFTLTIRAYRTNDQQTMLVDIGVEYLYFKPGGAISVHKADGASWQDTGVSLPLNTWVDVIIQGNRSDNSFTVSVQPVGGEATVGTLAKGIVKTVGITGVKLCATSNGTVSPYIDGIWLNKLVLAEDGETVKEVAVLAQNFEDTASFKANVTEGYTAGSADTVGAYWSQLHPHNRENGAAIYRIETAEGDGQVVQLKRGTSNVTYDSIRLYGSVNNGVASNEDFTLTIRAYRTNDQQTMLLDIGVDVLYFKPGGAISVHKADGINWQDTGVSLPLNTWVDVIIQSNRSDNTFTVSVQPVGGELVEGTLAKGIMKTVGIAGINMCATSNSTVSPYIDSIVLTKKESVGVTADYLVAMNPEVGALVGESVNVQINVISTTKNSYNTFRYELSYDPDKLTYTDAVAGVSVDSSIAGKLVVTGSGMDRNLSGAIQLTFTTKENGATTVVLEKAYVDESRMDDPDSLTAALITCSDTFVTISGYRVTLPDDFEGPAGVAEGEDYTFVAMNPNCVYTFDGSTMGGASVEVINNGAGRYTVENVCGDVIIVSQVILPGFGVNLTLNKTIDINLHLPVGVGMEGNVTSVKYTDGTPAHYTIVDGENGPMIRHSVNADKMTQQIVVQVFDAEGNPLTKESTISVRDYAAALLAISTNPVEQAMIIRMLDYGALAQLFVDANATDLANSVVNDELRSFIDSYNMGTAEEYVPNHASSDGVFFVNLTLNESVMMNIYTNESQIGEGEELVVKLNGKTLAASQYQKTVDSEGKITIRYSVNADRMTEEVSVAIVNKVTGEIRVETFLSIRAYCHACIKAYIDENPTLCAMLVAMLDYGALAQQYAGTNTNDLANRYIGKDLRDLVTEYNWPKN